MENKDITAIMTARLKSIIDERGFQYMHDHAYEIYELFMREKQLDDVYARVLLSCLLSADFMKAKEADCDLSLLSVRIQKNCALRKSVADQMAEVFLLLFASENMRDWQKKDLSGFREFCAHEWELKWSGFSRWQTSGGSMDCRAKVTAAVRITEPEQVKKDHADLLGQNPFTTADEIRVVYQRLLSEKLDSDFDYYCTCDDYYPPVVEDYGINCEEQLDQFCSKHGMELIDFDYSGDLSDYIPDHNNSW